ncbi:MAG: phosphate ABC transporter permease PstA [Bacillaceae bacterium]
MKVLEQNAVLKRMNTRLRTNKIFRAIFIGATLISLVILAVLLYRIFTQGFSGLSLDFFTNYASRRPANAGIKAALVGTIWLMVVTTPISLILGIGTAVYLEEYARQNALTRFIQVNIQNLAGVPSIIFGLLGLTFFVNGLGLGRSILTGALTMSLLVLPVIVVAGQEALRSVPKQLKEASYGMGATKWQTIYKVVLPYSLPGILTGSILGLSRAIGETAPLLIIGALSFVNYLPKGILDTFTVLPIQIYNWTTRPQEAFQEIAASGIIVLLIILLLMNSVAVLIRNKFNKRY